MDTNRHMVYSAMEMGVGREAMSVMCDIFNMPPPCHHKVWDQHVAALYVARKKAVITWSKRGYTANFGVGFVISVETGDVLDFNLSRSCAQSVHQQRRIWVKILPSMPFGTVGIKMSAPKPILDQVVRWSAQ